MSNRTSTAYVATVTSLSSIDLRRIRDEVIDNNRRNRERGLRDRRGVIQHRLIIYPRLGKNNPYRELYAVGGPLHRRSSQTIRREHGTRFDLYVQRRYPSYK